MSSLMVIFLKRLFMVIWVSLQDDKHCLHHVPGVLNYHHWAFIDILKKQTRKTKQNNPKPSNKEISDCNITFIHCVSGHGSWKSEGSIWELILSFYLLGSGDGTQVMTLLASSFTCRPISLIQEGLLLLIIIANYYYLCSSCFFHSLSSSNQSEDYIKALLSKERIY